MTVSRKSRQKSKISLLLSVILTIAVIFTGCDNSGSSDSSGTSGTGELEYMGKTTSLTQLAFDKLGPVGSAYNTDIHIYTDGIDVNNESGSGMIIYLETFFSTSEVTEGTYNWTNDTTPGPNTFSAESEIITVVNGSSLPPDPITAGSLFTISIDGSIYTINGTLQTADNGPAVFSYTGPVNVFFEE
ncbi:MAG: hypothetical protein RBT69_07105 [Spirochaetia bacterium]|jgi:hypothetical protein|nr:hypothetical protein [Spirochaetia bacterium]